MAAPTSFNGLPVVRKWADLKVSYKACKVSNVIDHGIFRLCPVQGGYVLLCCKNGCRGLMSKTGFCKNHNIFKESYDYCQHEGRFKSASQGYEYNKPLDGMTNIKHPDCDLQGHRIDNIVNLPNEVCRYPGCILSSSYACEGEPAQYCVAHKLNNMVNVKSRQSKYPGRFLQVNSADKSEAERVDTSRGYPVFDFPNNDAKYCASHKLNKTVKVKKCKYPGCSISPVFGYPGGVTHYCYDHKLEGMVNVKSRRCAYPICTKIPCFGYEGGSAKYCSSHKSENMVNLSYVKCKYPGCNNLSTFGYEGCPLERCLFHKLDNMINLKTKRCRHPECSIRPSFGHKGGSIEYCSSHKLHGMINLKIKRCQHPYCDNRAYYAYGGNEIYCLLHKDKHKEKN